MPKIYDICFARDSYTNKDGEEKTNWQRVGSIFENSKGNKYILLDRYFNPAGLDSHLQGHPSVLLQVFEHKS